MCEEGHVGAAVGTLILRRGGRQGGRKDCTRRPGQCCTRGLVLLLHIEMLLLPSLGLVWGGWMDVATIGERCGGLLEKVGGWDAGRCDCRCPGYWAVGDGSDSGGGKGGRQHVGCGDRKDREGGSDAALVRRRR